ncbi:MAG: hypothetical protein R3Y26_01600 [Rikenellaceae bacterium]
MSVLIFASLLFYVIPLDAKGFLSGALGKKLQYIEAIRKSAKEHNCNVCSATGYTYCYMCKGERVVRRAVPTPYYNPYFGEMSYQVQWKTVTCESCGGSGGKQICTICESRVNEQIARETLSPEEYKIWETNRINLLKAQIQIQQQYSETMDELREKRRDAVNNRYGYIDCKQCNGTGRCSSCNGKGYTSSTYTSNYIDCHCSDGKCSTCNGTGKRYGLK